MSYSNAGSSETMNFLVDTSLGNGKVQSLPKKRSESRGPTKRKPSTAPPTAKENELTDMTPRLPKTTTRHSDPSPCSPHRPQKPCLSPGKLGRNLSGSITPMLTPVMKGLRILSRNIRHPSPSAMRASEGESLNVGSDGDRMLFLGLSSSWAGSEPSCPVDIITATSHTTAKRLSTDDDIKAIVPPSGRFNVPPGGDDEHDDPPPSGSNVKKTSSWSTGSPTGRPRSSKNPSSFFSSFSLNKSLSGSSSSSNKNPPSMSSVSSGEKPSSSKKPTSSSTAGSSEVPPRPTSLDFRRRVPRPPHRKSEEISTKVVGGSGDETTPQPRRARSATPRGIRDDDKANRELPERVGSSLSRRGSSSQSRRRAPRPPHETLDETPLKMREVTVDEKKTIPRRARSATPRRQRDVDATNGEPAENADTVSIRRRSNSQKSSSSRRHPIISRVLNTEERSELSMHKSSSHKLRLTQSKVLEKNFVSAVLDPADPTHSNKSTKLERRDTIRDVPSRGEKEVMSEAVIARSERREKARQVRSKSGDYKSTVVNVPLKPRRARSSSSDKSNTEAKEQKDSKPARRGRKPSLGEVATTGENFDNPEKASTNHVVGQRRRSTEDGQHPHERSITLDEAFGEPGPDRQPLTDSFQRKNIDKEALEHVKSLKDDLKEIRMQHRQARFRSKPVDRQDDGECADSDVLPFKSGGAPVVRQDRQETKSPQPKKSRVATGRSRMSVTLGASQASLKSEFSSSKSMLHSSKTDISSKDASSSKLMRDFNCSYISIQDLDIGYIKATPPTLSEYESEAITLLNKIKKTKKLIKRATSDVWTQREEITNLQRTNWSIRKALMQIEGPRDSLTTLNIKIEKLLRQERELDLEFDRIREEKEALEAECAKTTKTISEFRDLHTQLNRTIVPLLPAPENAPRNGGSADSFGTEVISPLPSSAVIMRVFTSAISESTSMADSLHSTEDYAILRENNLEQGNETSLSLSNLRVPMLS